MSVPCPRHTLEPGSHHDYACPLFDPDPILPRHAAQMLAKEHVPCHKCGGPTTVRALPGFWDGWCRKCDVATVKRIPPRVS